MSGRMIPLSIIPLGSPDLGGDTYTDLQPPLFHLKGMNNQALQRLPRVVDDGMTAGPLELTMVSDLPTTLGIKGRCLKDDFSRSPSFKYVNLALIIEKAGI